MRRKTDKYAVTEIITTGLNFKQDKLVHIATIIVQNGKIIDSIVTYVNPQTAISSEWSRATYISKDTLNEAPKFYEIAKDLINLWQDSIILSSNARLTYTFIKSEFQELGFPFNLPYKSLEEIINIQDVHFDSGPKKASIIADLIIVQNITEVSIKKDLTPKGLLSQRIDEMPNTCGVYFLKNHEERVIYIGKALKIRSRLRQHFRNLNRKGFDIYRKVSEIEYQETSNELYALLLEAYLIRKVKPELNKALKSENYKYGLVFNENKEEHSTLSLLPLSKCNPDHVVIKFKSKKSGVNYIRGLIELGLTPPQYVHVDRYNLEKIYAGAIFESMDYRTYNIYLKAWVRDTHPFYKSTCIVRQRGTPNSFCLIVKGNFYGFSMVNNGTQELTKAMQECEYVFDSNYSLNVLGKNKGNIKLHLRRDNI